MTTLVTTWDDWIDAVGEPGRDRPIALDLETTGLSPWTDSIAVLGLYDEVSDTCAAIHYPRTEWERANKYRKHLPSEVVEWLSQPERFFIGHNACGFDMYFLWETGVDIFQPLWFDTLIAEGVAVKAARRDVRVNLQSAYKRRLGRELKKDIDHRTWQAPTLTEEQLEYVMHDLVHIPRLRRAQLADVAGSPRERAMTFEQQLMMVVARMVINGLPVEKEKFRGYIEWLADHRTTFEARAREIAGRPTMNLNSHQQIRAAFSELGRPLPKTDIETLTRVRDGDEGPAAALAESILLYRLAKQRVNMYNDAFFDNKVIRVDGGHVVRARYWQVGTDTGRFSSSDPNLQQVAGDCRTFFGRIGNMECGTLDYSQLEVRIAAWLSDDEALLDALDAEDVHSAVAAAIFQKSPEDVTKAERKLAKAGTFTFLFGGGAGLFHATARSQGSEMSLNDAKAFEAAFFERFSGLARVRAAAYSAARNRPSISITMPHGLVRTLAGQTMKPTTILNTAVQGGAASGLKKALLLCRDYGVWETLAGTVHDELIQIAEHDDLVNRIVPDTRRAMEDGMLWAFPGEKFGKPFPVKVGVAVKPHWDGPPPHTLESLMEARGRHTHPPVPSGATGPTTRDLMEEMQETV